MAIPLKTVSVMTSVHLSCDSARTMKPVMAAKWLPTVDCLESIIYTDHLSRYSPLLLVLMLWTV